MTHFSLKSTALAASLLALSLGAAVFAEPVKTECTKDPLFATNECNVCYTDKFDGTKADVGWTTEITDLKIPWEHGGGDLGEVILESEQSFPELTGSTGVTYSPLLGPEVWEFDTDIVWYPVGSDREYFIEKGTTNNLYTIKTGGKLTVSGKSANDTLLIKTALSYEDYNKDFNESAVGKKRNICVLGTFSSELGTAVKPTDTVVPPVDEKPKVTPYPAAEPALNAAGPEEEVSEEPEITPEQTKTQAGPEMWIFLLLAFIFSSAWTAWNKQKI